MAVTDRWYRSDADDAARIRAMILCDDVDGDDSNADRTECDGNCMEPRKLTSRVQKTRHRMNIPVALQPYRALADRAAAAGQ